MTKRSNEKEVIFKESEVTVKCQPPRQMMSFPIKQERSPNYLKKNAKMDYFVNDINVLLKTITYKIKFSSHTVKSRIR